MYAGLYKPTRASASSLNGRVSTWLIIGTVTAPSALQFVSAKLVSLAPVRLKKRVRNGRIGLAYQKNKILRTLLANSVLDQKRLPLNLLKPFTALLGSRKTQTWLTTIEEVITTIKQDMEPMPSM